MLLPGGDGQIQIAIRFKSTYDLTNLTIFIMEATHHVINKNNFEIFIDVWSIMLT